MGSVQTLRPKAENGHPYTANKRSDPTAPGDAAASYLIRLHPWSLEDALGEGEEIEVLDGWSPADTEGLRALLMDDWLTEFDGRHLEHYVAGLAIETSPEFRHAMDLWARDEERHHAGFGLALTRLFGPDFDRASTGSSALASRRANFGPLEEFFREEFTILLLGAYDELCTVRGYRANLAIYDGLGARFGHFVRRVIADEAWHYRLFLGVLGHRHRHRLGEAPEWIERIRRAESVSYGKTFVLDHDDKELYNTTLCDQAQRALTRQVERLAMGSGAARV